MLPKHAQVVMVHDETAVEAYCPRPDVVRSMVTRGLLCLTGKTNLAEAWRTLVSTQDMVGIKVYSLPGAISGTRPAVVSAVVEGLLAAGVAPPRIIVWDKRWSDLQRAGFTALEERYGIRVAGCVESGFDEKVFYEASLVGQLAWGDLEFGRKEEGIGRKSFVSKLVTREITRIINVTPLLNHYQAGVAGNLYGLAMGSVDNTPRFENDKARLTEAVPEIVALPALGDRVALNIVDALICQYEGEQRGLLHYSVVLNQLRLGTDPVALDVLSLKELQRQRHQAKLEGDRSFIDLYRNASLLEIGISEDRLIHLDVAP